MSKNMISVDALLEFAVLEASAYEQRQLPPLNDLNQLYPASDFLKQKIHKILLKVINKILWNVNKLISKKVVAYFYYISGTHCY